MKTYAVASTLMSTLIACGTDAPPDPPGPMLPEGVFAFDGTLPTLPSADLEPLWTLVGDAHLIGLGEAVHTSGGFYEAKERLIRTLIEERGVRWFAMETPRLQTGPLLDFLAGTTCETLDPHVFMRGMFPVFASDRTAALMRFVCTWNVEHPTDRVTLFGIDMQEPAEDKQALLDFFGAFAAADAAGLASGVDACIANLTTTMVTDADHDTCGAGMTAIDDYLTAHEAALTTAAGARAVRLAHLAAASWRSYEDVIFFDGRDDKKSFELRDDMMRASSTS